MHPGETLWAQYSYTLIVMVMSEYLENVLNCELVKG